MCEKVGYPSVKKAKTAITTIKKNSHRSQIPKRAYFCKQCHEWHLTSQYKE